MTDNNQANTPNILSYKEVTDYENILIRFYHSYLSCNYLAELLNTALRHLPEDADVQTLADFAEEYEEVSILASDAAQAWTEIYFDMIEGIPSPFDTTSLSNYNTVKKEMQANISRVWLRVSEAFTPAQHDVMITELDYALSSQDIQEQYDQVLSGMYPTLPDNIRLVIENLKQRADSSTTQSISVTSEE